VISSVSPLGPRRLARQFVGIALVAIAVVACDPLADAGTPPPLDYVPSRPQIDVIGTISGETTEGDTTDYQLADGRTVKVDSSTRRRVGPPGGSPAILVVGSDDRGGWVAVVGHQDGTPDGCHVLNQLGYDLGESIAIAGVRWKKAPGFHTSLQTPSFGSPYPEGARFCLDEHAQVAEIIAP